MKKLVFVLALLVYGMGFAQDNSVSGNILDGEFGNEPLAFAKVSIKNTDQVVASDMNGVYSMQLEPGTYTLVIEFTGYETIEVENVLVKDQHIKLNAISLHAKKIAFENSIASKG